MPLQSAVIRVRYARASQLPKQLGFSQSLLVSDIPAWVAAMRQWVGLFDAPLQQVAIKAKIVTASDTLNHQLGIQWRADNGQGQLAEDNSTVYKGMNSLVATTALVVAAPASTLALGVLRSGVQVDAKFSLLAAKGHARVLAKPKFLPSISHLPPFSPGCKYHIRTLAAAVRHPPRSGMPCLRSMCCRKLLRTRRSCCSYRSRSTR